MSTEIINDYPNIQNLRNNILEELDKNEVDEFDKDSYEMMLEKLSELEKLLSVKEFNLVFIGQKGVGKTTAISNLFNLLIDRSITGKGRSRKVIEEILETGAGGTTVCDVEINQSPTETSQILIEPYSNNDILNEIETFCNIIWKRRMNSIDNFDENRTFYLASEVERAIRNMTALTVVKEVDIALERAKEFLGFEDFKNEIIHLAELDNRNKIQFVYESHPEALETEAYWIKSTFRDINLVKFTDILIPKKIIVSLSKKILDFDDLPRIKSIIDTRGLDSQTSFDRKDIEKYIREDIENLCIVTDSFPPSPSEPVFNLFKRYLYDESLRDLSAKMILMILHRKDEASDIVSYNGTVEDAEEGIKVRRREIESKFVSEQIPMLTDNILFFDALFGIDDKKIKVTEDDIEEYGIDEARHVKYGEVRKYHKEMVSVIEKIINKREREWLNELNNIFDEFKSIKYHFENDTYAEEHLSRIKNEVDSIKDTQADYKTLFTDLYLNKMGFIHPSTFAAINRSYGIFSSNDIFYLGSVTIEEIYKEHFKKAKDQIISKIDTIRSFHNITIKTKTFFNRLYDKVNKEFDISMRELNDKIYILLNKEVFNNNENGTSLFWDNARLRWGGGSGYREDIQIMYRRHLQKSIYFTEINLLVEAQWNKFLQVILSAGGKSNVIG
ncbi:hypothetical protein HGO21_08305 [Acinetobacter sp. CUI P1]|nr:hypothetical protein [Acinetobacter sp. CUI P1]